MSDPQDTITLGNTLGKDGPNVSGRQPSGGARILDLASSILHRLDNNTKLFLAFGFACLAVLAYSAKINHEQVSTGVGIVAVAVFGGSAWKNHADKAYGNGNGNGNGTTPPNGGNGA